jgi:U32 family peptidase
MKTFLHTENLNVLKRLKDKEWDCIITEPRFSYRHPYIQTEKQFKDFYQNAMDLGYHPYIQINGYIEESELLECEAWIKTLIQLNPKGFYFNDYCIYNQLKQNNYSGEIIYSPETILTNAIDIEAILELVDRVVLSKELTLDEITQLMRQFPDKIEALGLGYGLMSFSKRPLVRNYLDEIHASIDVLNQTNLVIKEYKRDQLFPILEENQGTSIFLDTVLFPKLEKASLEESMCYGLHFDDCMLDEETFIQLTHDFIDDSITLNDAQMKSKVKLGQAYYYRKTNMSKEEGK